MLDSYAESPRKLYTDLLYLVTSDDLYLLEWPFASMKMMKEIHTKIIKYQVQRCCGIMTDNEFNEDIEALAVEQSFSGFDISLIFICLFHMYHYYRMDGFTILKIIVYIVSIGLMNTSLYNIILRLHRPTVIRELKRKINANSR